MIHVYKILLQIRNIDFFTFLEIGRARRRSKREGVVEAAITCSGPALVMSHPRLAGQGSRITVPICKAVIGQLNSSDRSAGLGLGTCCAEEEKRR